ncbi:MAG: TlpA disulfide reductase family protein [Candidatus Omnitrophota bacterium]
MVRKILSVFLFLVLIQGVIFGLEPLQSKPGVEAAGVSLKDLNGTMVSISGNGDKPVLLLFWTTWCPYCRKELGRINSEYATLKNQGLEVFPINVGENQAKVSAFVKKNNFTFPVLLDENSSLSGNYNVMGIPTYILLDKKGVVKSKSNSFPQKEYKALLYL